MTFVTKLQTITIQNVFTRGGRYGTDVIRILSSSHTVATRSFQFAYIWESSSQTSLQPYQSSSTKWPSLHHGTLSRCS